MATRVSLGALSKLASPSIWRSRWMIYALIAVVTFSMVLAVAVRGLAWNRWVAVNEKLPEKVYIDAFDPWIEYWLARYLYEHGLGSWWSLHPPNPAVMKFWYPWGRDFTRTAYPLVPMLIAATYPIGRALGLSFQQWAAWVPALAGAFLVLFSTLLLYRRFGILAAMTAAIVVALLPATADRTLLGFIEKEGITLSIVILSVLFVTLTIEHIDDPVRRRVYALLAGLAAAAVGLGWGGYLLPVGIFIVSMLLLPASGHRIKLEYVDAPLLYWAGLLPAMMFSRWRGIHALLVEPGGLVLATAAVLAVLAVLYKWLEANRVRRGVVRIIGEVLERPIVYAIVFAMVGFVVFVAAAEANILPLRVSYLLLPGYLKEIAVRKAGPLVESVAEHYPDIGQLLQEAGVGVLLFALAGLGYMLYRIVVRGERGDIPLFVAGAVTYYAMMNAAYFTQTGSVFAALSAAALLGILYEGQGLGARPKRRAAIEEHAVAYTAIALIVAALLIVDAVAVLAPKLPLYAARLPMLLTSSVTLTVKAPSWYQALLYIKRHTTPDTVVVSWWDYGYWISVFGDRPSVADGATLNTTQISLLARVLVGPYSLAEKILANDFHCKPGKTIIIAYSVYYLVRSGSVVQAVLQPGQGDYAKSYWMVRIGGFNVNNYMSTFLVTTPTGQVTQVMLFDPRKPAFRNAILYRLLVQAPLMLGEKGVVKLVDPRIEELVKGATISSMLPWISNGRFTAVSVAQIAPEMLAPPPGFKPYLVAAYPIQVAGNQALVVIVAAYEWVG